MVGLPNMFQCQLEETLHHQWEQKQTKEGSWTGETFWVSVPALASTSWRSFRFLRSQSLKDQRGGRETSCSTALTEHRWELKLCTSGACLKKRQLLQLLLEVVSNPRATSGQTSSCSFPPDRQLCGFISSQLALIALLCFHFPIGFLMWIFCEVLTTNTH